jgi:aromatic-L-amino-acid decarboxylase
MDYGVSLGRRFRALKLWFVLRWFGAEGIRARLREHLRLAAALARWIEDEPGWELVAPVPFSTVVFRRVGEGLSAEEEGRLNMRLLERVNASGEAFLSHTVLGGRVAIRLAIGNLRTEEGHVRRAWDLLRVMAGEAEGSATPAQADG